MRVDVEKVIFVGPEQQRVAFFTRAQEVGIIQFLDAHGVVLGDFPEEIQKLSAAHKVLKHWPERTQVEIDNRLSTLAIAEKILLLNERLTKGLDEERVLFQEIPRVEVFGDFSWEDLRALERETHRKVRFFWAKTGKGAQAEQLDGIFFVGSQHGLDYYMALSEGSGFYDGLVEMHIERPVGQLRARLEAIRAERKGIESELKELAQFLHAIDQALVLWLDDYHLTATTAYAATFLDRHLFAVEAWVPRNKLLGLNVMLQELDVHWEIVAPEKVERVPTYLENKKAAKLGEDLVHIYDTPSTSDKDPSLWVFCFFTLFFALIIGDGGYGLIILLVSAFCYYKFRDRGGLGKRVIKLFMVLAIATMVWGVLSNAYFGMSVPIHSPLRQISLVHWIAEKQASYHLEQKTAALDDLLQKYPVLKSVHDPKQFVAFTQTSPSGVEAYPVLDHYANAFMMELALFLGAIHVATSMLRNLRRHWAGLGWVVFLIGSYLYFPVYLDSTSLIHYVFQVPYVAGGRIGLELLFGGFAGAVVLALIQKKLEGLAEIMVVIQVFADVLSYLRLYALGLAGAMMSATFNRMGEGVGFTVGFLVILVGHGVNFTLGIMSGFIHGLRLNFLEWYHYSFEGGGKIFKPLALVRPRANTE